MFQYKANRTRFIKQNHGIYTTHHILLNTNRQSIRNEAKHRTIE